MRLTGAQLSSVTGDVGGEEARVAHESFTHLMWIELALGVLGAIAAIGMGLVPFVLLVVGIEFGSRVVGFVGRAVPDVRAASSTARPTRASTRSAP